VKKFPLLDHLLVLVIMFLVPDSQDIHIHQETSYVPIIRTCGTRWLFFSASEEPTIEFPLREENLLLLEY
jgi:hypothetical protein